MAVENCAQSIGATRVWVARILGWWDVALCLAEEVWVTSVARWTAADRVVILNVAVGIDAA